MLPLEQSEEYFLSNGISESNLLLCGKYISLYVKELCSVYSIDITKRELNETSKVLTRTILDLMIRIHNSADISLSEQLINTINDFESDSKKGIGNIIPLLDRAKQNDYDTRIINSLYDIFIPEGYDEFPQL